MRAALMSRLYEPPLEGPPLKRDAWVLWGRPGGAKIEIC
jgi:hypothetical protein